MATKGKAQDHFRAKAPGIMLLLMRDFKLAAVDAAAILGNLGHESAGLTVLQEVNPTVKGSRGGYGWAQWTGPRRKSYEAYCRRNGLDPASDKANYGWLFSELKGPERKALDALRQAKTLGDKVKAFEKAYERAGKKHYESRNTWAAIALEAFNDAGNAARIPEWALPAEKKPADAPSPPEANHPVPVPEPAPAPAPAPNEPLSTSKRFWTWLVTLVTALGTLAEKVGWADLDWRVQIALLAVVALLAVYGIGSMPRAKQLLGRLFKAAP